MELYFEIETKKTELVINDEYTLFWQSQKNKALFDEIGICKVQLEGNKIICSARITTGGIRHSIDDNTTSEFYPARVLEERYKYGILFKEDSDGNDYISGFCLFDKF